MRSKTWDITRIPSVGNGSLHSLLCSRQKAQETRLSSWLSYRRRRVGGCSQVLRQPTAVAVAAKEAVRVQHDSAYHQPQTQISSPGGARPVGCFDMYIGGRLD